MRLLFGWMSLLCLGLCLAVPFLHFFGQLGEDAFKQILAFSSAGWFLFATLWVSQRKRS
jgi:hypothetical protein